MWICPGGGYPIIVNHGLFGQHGQIKRVVALSLLIFARILESKLKCG